MEKEAFFSNWQQQQQQQQQQQTSDNSADQNQQLPSCFLNLNWDQSIDQAANFESALSSLVSSPSSNPQTSAAADSVVIRELIGRLGSICNSGEISPTSHYQSTTTSCYSTPLNSPPKLNLSMMNHRGIPIAPNTVPFAAADPGFAERAARYSCFGGGRNYGGSLSRVSSSQSLKAVGGKEISMQEEAEFCPNVREESSPAGSLEVNNGRKRKAGGKGKGKETPLSANHPKVVEEDCNAKRCRSADAVDGVDVKPKAEQNGETSQKQGKENKEKPVELPKLDYIHVRARRGQATDSHSLAERVRREKISERMKFLQELVPGCNKVTGKAVMLDEIINYVQSLQRQVEFLSMKLATVNPRLDFNPESLLPKDMLQSRGPMPQQSVYPLEATSAGFSYGNQPQGPPLQSLMANGLETQCTINHLDSALRRSLGMQLPALDGFGDVASQLGAFWEDDLQSVVQMGFGQNQENVFSSQNFQGSLPTNHMKIEL